MFTENGAQNAYQSLPHTAVQSDNFYCGLKPSGRVECWGKDNYGQVSDVPSTSLSSIFIGKQHGCGIDDSGDVHCWGADYYGQATPPNATFSTLSLGEYHTCGIRTSGSMIAGVEHRGETTRIYRWNIYNLSSQHNVYALDTLAAYIVGVDRFSEFIPSGTFTAISSGENHSCAGYCGLCHCWDASTRVTTTPSTTFSSISTGIILHVALKPP